MRDVARVPRVWLLLGSVLVVLVTLGSRPGSLDDVFIVLRAARDPMGESDPALMGCSSLLDVLAKRLLLGLPDPAPAAGWFTLLLLFLGVAQAGRWARERGAPGISLVSLALLASLGDAGSYLLEAPLVLLLLVPLARTLAEGEAPSPWLCLLLAWVRPEAALAAAASLFCCRAPRGRRARALGALGLGVGVWMLVLWRAGGPWLPLSFYAKSGERWAEISAGLVYVGTWLTGSWGGPSTLLLLAAGLLRGAGARRIALLALFWLGLVVVSGGDGYLGSRLLMPVEVLAWAAAVEASRGLGPDRWLVGLGLLGLGLQGAVRIPGGLAATGHLFGGGALEAEEGLARALMELDGATSGRLRVGHRDQQVLGWLAPGLALRDASGLTDPSVASIPLEGAVRHGRDAFGAIAPACDVLLMDHQRWRPLPWAGLPLGHVLQDGARDWLPGPRPVHEVTLLEGSFRTASVQVGPGWVNVLLREDLFPDLVNLSANWKVD